MKLSDRGNNIVSWSKMNNQRAPKRACYNMQVIGREDTAEFNTFTALTIKENKEIDTIEKCDALRVLSLIDTTVKTISNCPCLHSLDILDNDGLTGISLPTVLEARITDCRDLQHLELTHAVSVFLDNLPKLTCVRLPAVEELVCMNFLWSNTFSMIANLSHLRVLKLVKVADFHESLLRILPTSVDVLVIKKCPIRTLAEIAGLRELTVCRCKFLTSIQNISDVETITISDCDNLLHIRHISRSGMIVNNCDRLVLLDELRLGMLFVEYCVGLVVLSQLDVRRLCVRQCPHFTELRVHTKTTRLTIDHCSALDAIIFSGGKTINYANLHIEMYGDSRIRVIKDWYVATLVVKENTYLQQIKGVCNLETIGLIECRNLHTISNMFVRENMTIESCANLESLSNVYGYANLGIADCPKLVTLGLRLIPSRVAILRCPALNISIDGTILKFLSLVNCGIGMVHNFCLTTHLDIHEVRSIPDMRSTSATQTIVARRFADRMKQLEAASRLLARWFRYTHSRRRYQRYISLKASNDLYDCPICKEPTQLENASFTRCEHLFHSGCIAQWLCIRQRCPVCNTK